MLGCPGDKFCGECKENSKNKSCSVCYFSFLQDEKCKEPKKKILDCVIYNDRKLCDQCKWNYQVVEKGKRCEACADTRCARCEDDKCESCYFNIVPDDKGKCDIKSKYKCIENCDICSKAK